MIESKFLKDNIQNIQRLLAIQPLRHFETKNLRQLLRLSKIREYNQGEMIIREGDHDPYIYFLLSGKVKVEKKGVDIVILEKPGELFGEMRILDGLDRSASIHAETRVVSLAVETTATDRYSTEDERAEFLLLLYRMFAEYVTMRLRLTNEELVKSKRLVQQLMDE